MKPRLAVWPLVALAFHLNASGADDQSVAVATGGYALLSASESPEGGHTFEVTLAARLGEQLHRPISMRNVSPGNDPHAAPSEADVLMGRTAGVVYFDSAISALGAAESGSSDWHALKGQQVCLTRNSPYASTLIQRFSVVPRFYPSTAHALIGLKLGECAAVAAEDTLLTQLAYLPEWVRYNRRIEPVAGYRFTQAFHVSDPALRDDVTAAVAALEASGELKRHVQFWIDEVAFEAYVLSDTLDCH
ncbi:type 2 periplasmic-binding domain-containing protein [Pseudomonas sp. Marseille-QA0892]